MITATCTLLLLLCDVLLADPICPYKECSCGQTDVMCDGRGLVNIPALLYGNNTYFTTVQFDRNNITVVTDGSLLANLTQISFIENPIATIEDNAFSGSANTLTSISFDHAHFIKLPDAFLQLNVLSFFTISESVVQDWNVNAMKHIGSSVATLSIENVALQGWPDWLQYFTNLTDLSISGGGLTDIPENGLDAQINILTDLSLDNNSLTEVPYAISKLITLQLLALDKNKISDVTWLPQSCKLRSLALNNNKLHDSNQLSSLVRTYSSTLVDFGIQSNLFTSFPNLDFLTHIFELDFVHNKLVDPNSGSLPSGLTQLKLRGNALPRIPRILTQLQQITELFIGSNAITELEGTAFPPNTRGCELDSNHLTEITDTSFPYDANITYILLTNNPLVKISDNAFAHLPHLVELNLSKTKLTRLPLALSALSKLDVFDITSTTDLICTCLEKSLQQWILLHEESRVKGTCGQSSIYYFYSVLSSDCP